MCGRFALYTPPARLARYFDAALDAGLDPQGSPSYNVAPTHPVLGLRHAEDGDGRLLGAYRWGLIPGDSRDPSVGAKLINARGDSLLRRPSFREGFKHQRLVVPADGFFEWRKDQGRSEPHFFTRTDGVPMAFAGLWAEWIDPNAADGAPPIRSCTIITTEANGDVESIHSRMPVVLPTDAIDVWLDPGFDREELDGLLVPPPDGTLEHHRVDRRVGNVRNNDPSLVTELGATEGGGEADDRPEQLSLLGNDGDRGLGSGGGRVTPRPGEGEQ